MTATQTRRTHSKTKLSLSLPAAAAMNQELPSEIPLLQSENANGETNPTPGSSQDVPFQWPFSAQGPPSPVPPSSPSQIHPDYRERFFSPDLSSNSNHSSSDRLTPSPWGIPPPTSPKLDDEPWSSTSSQASARSKSSNPKAAVAFDEKQRPRPFYAISQPAALPPALNLLSPRMKELLDTPQAWLVYYFVFNLGLTLYNKLVLVKFPFPWALTAIHTLCGGTGCYVLHSRGVFQAASLSASENAVLVAFSVLYTVNIAVSNLSLNLVTVPFHQVVRAMTPLFAIAIGTVFLRKRHSRKTYMSLVPVVMGVAFATYGDYYFTAWGFFLTILGTLLAALKTIVTNLIQVGRLKLHPLDLLMRMAPLAFVQCVIYSYASGELERVREYGALEMDRSRVVALLLNGVIAFFLNIVSFSANKKTSALTMTVAANVKQVLTILFVRLLHTALLESAALMVFLLAQAVYMFDLSVTATNLLGISLTLGGGAWYAHVEYTQKQQKAAQAAGSAVSQAPLVQIVDGAERAKA